MKRTLLLTGMALLCLGAFAIAGDDKPWFDMANCEMCSMWSSVPELMQNMEWEQHKISDGMLSISEVEDEYLEAYRNANRKANELGKKLMSGYQAEMCGSCMAMGSCLAHGASMEQIETKDGMIMLLTADKPEVVAEIHTLVDRNKEEMAKLMQGGMHDDAHQGHGHDDGHGHDGHGH